MIRVTRATVTVKMLEEYRRDMTLCYKSGKALLAQQEKNEKLEGEVILNHSEASRWLRLPYCLTIRNSQGITVRNTRMMLMSLGVSHFSVRSLIVGSSRVTHGDLLHVPTARQEAALLGKCPEVPLPPDACESEDDPWSDEE